MGLKKQEELEAELKYLNTIIDVQKTFCAVYDSNYSLEYVNETFSNFLMANRPKEQFSLTRTLHKYEDYSLPPTDKEFIELLDNSDDFKTSFVINYENGAKESTIFSVELSKFLFLGDKKYIVVLTDITTCEKAKKRELELLQNKQKYKNDQEISAFMKQTKIIKDDVSHRQMNGWFFDSHFKPLDILSGDTYGTIHVGEGVFLFYLVDAMGKGLAASVTSIQATAFINNSVEIAVAKNDFVLEPIITTFCTYIKKQLLDDELLCVTFVLFDTNNETLFYSNFGMPPIILETIDGNIKKESSNNPPIMSFFDTRNITKIDIKDVMKVLLYSDGLSESVTKSARVYDTFIENDFFESNTLGDFVRAFTSKTIVFDDDITIIEMLRANFSTTNELDMVIESSHKELETAQEYIENVIEKITDDPRQRASLHLSITELIMNGHEHGNLKLTSDQKQSLLASGEYDETIARLESLPENMDNKIFVSVYLSNEMYNKTKLLKIEISDSGEGFDFVDVIKKARHPYNFEFRGRGIKMSLESVGGIYYNSKGKKVTILDSIKYKKRS